MSRKEVMLALIAGALGAFAFVAPAFALVGTNHNETFKSAKD